jgi:dihydrofolate synthase/folylpolyglutamate synthase
MPAKFPLTKSPELNYLYALNGRGIKFGLDRVRQALSALGNPQDQYYSIHVAGTNGKGSTCAMLTAALQQAGWRVGLYTSPHLLRFNERIRVNGVAIPDDYLQHFIRQQRAMIDKLSLTFFEATTVLAMQYFADQHVDCAVFETGMGGRLDATNVLKPLVTVITPIGHDHEEFLGKKLVDIAKEKAGIAKNGQPCVIAKQSPSVKNHLLRLVELQGAAAYYAPAHCTVRGKIINPQQQSIHYHWRNGSAGQLSLPLIGQHQQLNLQTALVALQVIAHHLPDLEKVIRGIEYTYWPGRLQVIQPKPLIFFDAGHNAHGMRAIVQALQHLFPERKIKLLLALGRTKRHHQLGKIFAPLVDWVYLTELPGYAAVPVAELRQSFQKFIPQERIVTEANPEVCLRRVMAELKDEDSLLILGSHYLAPVVYPYFQINV